LIEGTLLRRYKRFLVDVRLGDGSEVAVHCPNTGSMLEINRPGARCLVLPNDSPPRRLRYTLEAVRVGRIWVGAHPLRANTVGREALEAGLVRGVTGVTAVRAEVPYGRSSRADLVLEVRRGSSWTVEIKSASLGAGRVARFPDSVTERGLKHLDELLGVVMQGERALMLFVATRDDVDVFRPAWDIDVTYARRLGEVAERGVVVRAVASRVTKTSMKAVRALPIDLRVPCTLGRRADSAWRAGSGAPK
jgi:sugar fermentation stimulation protein A